MMPAVSCPRTLSDRRLFSCGLLSGRNHDNTTTNSSQRQSRPQPDPVVSEPEVPVRQSGCTGRSQLHPQQHRRNGDSDQQGGAGLAGAEHCGHSEHVQQQWRPRRRRRRRRRGGADDAAQRADSQRAGGPRDVSSAEPRAERPGAGAVHRPRRLPRRHLLLRHARQHHRRVFRAQEVQEGRWRPARHLPQA